MRAIDTLFVFALSLICAIQLTEATTTFIVQVAPKTLHRHPHFARGVSVGYTINGREGADLTLQQGKTYTFDVSHVDCAYPFIISTSEELPVRMTPAESNVVHEGVSFDAVPTEPATKQSEAATPASPAPDQRACRDGARRILFTPTAAQVGLPLFYQSSALPLMGSKLTVVAETFCNKYSRIQQVTNYQFIERVANATFFLLTKSGPELIGFFTGHVGPTNYFKDVDALDVLRKRLCAYFGNAYGCTDAGYPSYDGPSMEKAHSKLPIGTPQFEGFINALVGAMQLTGVEPADLAWANEWLHGFKQGAPYGVCNSLDCRASLCDTISDTRYATHEPGTRNMALLSAVWDDVFESVLDAYSPLRAFFDGTRAPFYLDLLRADGLESLAMLKRELAQASGDRSTLSCTDAEVPAVFTGLSIRFSSVRLSNKEGLLLLSYVGEALSRHGFVGQHQRIAMDLLHKQLLRQEIIVPSLPSPALITRRVQVSVSSPVDSALLQFAIDGVPGAALQFEAGVEYIFQVGSSCATPLLIASEADALSYDQAHSGTSAAVSVDLSTIAGAISTDPTLVCEDKHRMSFIPLQRQIGAEFRYLSLTHRGMGGAITVVKGARRLGLLHASDDAINGRHSREL